MAHKKQSPQLSSVKEEATAALPFDESGVSASQDDHDNSG